jgi:hypothetical protein
MGALMREFREAALGRSLEGPSDLGAGRFRTGQSDLTITCLGDLPNVGILERSAFWRTQRPHAYDEVPLRSSSSSHAAHKVVAGHRLFATPKEGQYRKFHYIIVNLDEDDLFKRYEHRFGDAVEAAQLVDTLVQTIVVRSPDPVGLAVDGITTTSVERYAFFHSNGPSQIAELIKQRKQGSYAYASALATARELDKQICSMDGAPDPVLLIFRGKLSQQIIDQSTVDMALDYAIQDRRTAFRVQLLEQQRCFLEDNQKPRYRVAEQALVSRDSDGINGGSRVIGFGESPGRSRPSVRATTSIASI